MYKEETSYIKSAAIIAGSAFVYRAVSGYYQRYMNMLLRTENAATRATRTAYMQIGRDKYRMDGESYYGRKHEYRPEPVKTAQYFGQMADDAILTGMRTPEEIASYSFSPETLKLISDANKEVFLNVVLGEDLAAQSLFTNQHAAFERLSKEYGQSLIHNLFDAGMEIDPSSVKEYPTHFEAVISNTKNRSEKPETIVLPKDINNTMIIPGKKPKMYVDTVSIAPSDFVGGNASSEVVLHGPGKLHRTEILSKNIRDAAIGGNTGFSMTRRIANAVDGALRQHYSAQVNGNIYDAISKTTVHVKDIEDLRLDPFGKDYVRNTGLFMQRIHGAEYVTLRDDGRPGLTGRIFNPAMTGESSKRFATSPGNPGPYITNLSSQSWRRGNFLNGRIGRPTGNDVAAMFNYITRNAEESLMQSTEWLPGGTTRTLFLKNSGIGEGASVLLTNRIGDDSANILRYESVVEKKFRILNPGDEKVRKLTEAMGNHARNGMGAIELSSILGDTLDIEGNRIPTRAEFVSLDTSGQFLDLRIKTRRPIGVHDKMDKHAINNISTLGNITSYVDTSSVDEIMKDLGKLPSRTGSFVPDLMVDFDLSSKYHGGATGMGVLSTVLTDVTRIKLNTLKNLSGGALERKIAEIKSDLRSVTEIMFDSDLAGAIDDYKITIDRRTGEYVTSVALREGVDFSHPSMASFANFDSRYSDFIKKRDMAGGAPLFVQYLEHAQSRIRTATGISGYNLYAVRQGKTWSGDSRTNMPSFILEKSMDGDRPVWDLNGVMISSFQGVHLVSASEMGRTAGVGGVNGSKLNIESITNAKVRNDLSLMEYTQHLTSVNNEYLVDMMHALSSEPMTTKEWREMGRGITAARRIGGYERKIHLVRQSAIGGARLPSGETLSEAFADAHASTAKPQTLLSDRVSIYNQAGEMMTLEKGEEDRLLSNIFDNSDYFGKYESYSGASPSFLRSDVMKEYLKLTNTGDESFMFMELPFEIEHNGKMIKAIPFNRIRPSDLFHLDANEILVEGGSSLDREGISLGLAGMSTAKGSYVTGASDINNVITTMSRIQDIAIRSRTLYMEQENGMPDFMFDPKINALKDELDRAVRSYMEGVKHAGTGKDSPIVRKMFRTTMPLSLQGNIGYSSKLKVGEVGLTRDAITRVLSQRKFDAFDAVKKTSRAFHGAMGSHEKDVDMATRIKAYGMLRGELATGLAEYRDGKTFAELVETRFSHFVEKDENGGYRFTKNAKGIKGYRAAGGDQVETMLARYIEKDMPSMERVAEAIFIEKEIADIKKDRVSLYANVIRNPELTPASEAMMKIKMVADSEFRDQESEKLYRSFYNYSNTRDAMGIGSERVFLARSLQGMINADTDGDIAEVILRSFEVLDRTRTELGVLEKVSAMNRIPEGLARKVSDSGIKEFVKSYLAKKAKGEDGEIKLIPATPSAFTMMHQLQKKEFNIQNHSVKVRDFVLSELEKENPTARGTVGLHRKATDITKEIMKEVGEKDTGRFGRDYRMVTELPGDLTLTIPNARIVRDMPNEFANSVIGMSQEEYNSFIAMNTEEKKRFHNEKLRQESESVFRNREMKLKTPTAFLTAKHMLESVYAITDADARQFTVAFLDKTMAQLTISVKKGNPSFLNDMVDTLTRYSVHGEQIRVDDIKKMATQNWIYDLTPGTHEEVKMAVRDGILGEVDQNLLRKGRLYADQYRDFLSKKMSATQRIMDVFRAVEDKRSRIRGKGADPSLIAELQGNLDNLSKEGSLTRSLVERFDKDGLPALRTFFDDLSQEMEIADTKGIDKFLLDPRRLDLSPRDQHHVNYRFEQSQKMIEAMIIQSKNSRKAADLQRSIRAVRIGKDLTPVHAYLHMELDDYARGRKDESSTVFHTNTAMHVMAMKAAQMAGQGINIGAISPEMMEKKWDTLKRRERAMMSEEKRMLMEDSGSLMRKRSLSEAIGRGTTRAFETAHMDKTFARVSTTRGRAVAAGIGIGAILGLTANQLLHGYSVPGLEKMAGRGGEYYENRGDIMGQDIQATMDPAPVKLVPTFRERVSEMVVASRLRRRDEVNGYGVDDVDRYQSRRIRGISI